MNKFKVIQRESNLEMHMYNGSLDAYLILDDIRVNDIIEYEYTLQGENPIYEGKFQASFSLQYGVPVKHLNVKILYPSNQPVFYKTLPSTLPSQLKESTGKWERSNLDFVQWEANDLPGVINESNQSEWYISYPFAIVSEYKTWQEVGAWASRVFSMEKQSLPQDFKDQIARWKKSSSNTKEVIDSVLLFVKDKIRYMGIEIGTSAIKPTAPSKVFERRFGDCKDKSVFLAAAIKELGYQAHPALVNSYSKSAIGQWLPAGIAFNHCIVHAVINDKEYWFDPTISGQRGTFSELYTPNYKLAFVVSPNSTELKQISGSRASGIKITEDFYVSDFGGNVVFKVETEYKGIEADQQRNLFKADLEEVKRSYENYYSSRYKNIKIINLSVEDFPASNTFVVKDEYEIEEFWTRDSTKTDNIVVAELYPQVVGEKLNTSTTANRTTPFRLEYPLIIEQNTTIHLPVDWPTDVKPIFYDNKYFKLDHKVENSGKKLFVKTFYTTNAEEVAPEDFKKFNQEQTHISNNLGLELTYNLDFDQKVAESSGKNWLLMVMFFMFLVFSGMACYRLYYYNPAPALEEPEGWAIGGWLFLIAFGLSLSPFRILFDVFWTNDSFNLTVWDNISNPKSSGYNPALTIVFVFELFVNAFMIAYAILLNVLFYKRRTSLPRLIIYMYVGSLAFSIISELYCIAIVDDFQPFEDLKQYLSLCMGVFVFVPYFHYSNRVKHTFSERLGNK